jgi:murein DD-endopeptidase MepM/ murein hydrolase activator NlpD
MPFSPLLSLLLAASPAVHLAPSGARPGDAVLVRVTGAAAEPRGSLAGRPLAFWRSGREWRALAALPTETPPGPAPVEIAVRDALVTSALEVVEPGFASQALTVAPRFVEPPEAVKVRIAADRRAFALAYDRPFTPPLFESAFGWPRLARTTGRYGDQRVFNGTKASVHYGLDISGPRGAPIKAANDGEVVIARDAYLSGKTVVIHHGAGVFSAYFHLDRMLVRAGRRVKRGQPIGRLGSSGRSTGPHLHWSAKVDGLYVDPESLLAIDFRRGAAPARAPRPSRAAPPTPPEPPPPEVAAPDAPTPPLAAPVAR